MARPVVVLPQPDSPTSPRVWPRSMPKDTSLTAWIGGLPRRAGKVTESLRTRSNGGGGGPVPVIGSAPRSQGAAPR